MAEVQIEEEMNKDMEEVKEKGEALGVMTRSRAERQRLEDQTEREAFDDGLTRVRKIVNSMEEKYGQLMTSVKFKTDDKKLWKEAFENLMREFDTDMGGLAQPMEDMARKTVELAIDGEKGRWLLDTTGQSTIEQVAVMWERKNKQLEGFIQLMRETLEPEGIESLPKLVEALRLEREKVEDGRNQWEERNAREETEKSKFELQITELSEENKLLKQRIAELEAANLDQQRTIQTHKEKESCEGGSTECARCVRKEEAVKGKKLSDKKEKNDVKWSTKYLQKQVEELQRVRASSDDTQRSSRSSDQSVRGLMEGSRPVQTPEPGERTVKLEVSSGEESSEESDSTSESDSSSSSDESDRRKRKREKRKKEKKKKQKVERDRESESGRRDQKNWQGKLPKMRAYDGNKEDWDMFEEGILVRYEGTEDRAAICMVEEALIGKAKTTFKDIPKSERRKGLKPVLKWLKKRLSEETPFEELENVKKLRKIVVGMRKVKEVVEEIERLVRKIEKNKEKREEMRKTHLLLVYEKTKYHGKLLDMWGEDESYDRMKAKLLQLEYMDEMKKDFGGEKRAGYHGDNRVIVCHNCKKTGHKWSECRQRSSTGGTSGGMVGGQRETRKCDHCNKVGHIKANCYALNGLQRRTMFNPTATPFKPNTGTTVVPQQTILQRGKMQVIVGNEERMEVDEDERESFFVIKKTREVKGEINGVGVSVILDTGAEASLIEERLLRGMKGVEVLSVNNKKVLQDAQQNPIETTGRAILNVTLEMGRSAVIGFFITRSEVGVIIGGKGLEDIGVELREIRKEGRVDREDGDGSEKDEWEETEEARVLNECSIPSGEMEIVWVRGDPKNAVILSAMDDAIIEGVSVREDFVGIPVVNTTEKEIRMEKNQLLGKWTKKREIEGTKIGKIARVRESTASFESGREWEILIGKIQENHEEGVDEEVMKLLKHHERVFAVHEDDLGRLQGYECGIDLLDQKPANQRPRTVPFAIREQLRVLMEKMKRQGVIEQSASPWNSPIVIVKKKNGSIRLCIDYRKVNQQIKLDAQPLPHLEATVQSLAGRRWFSTIDLSSGFWQIGLNEQAREITAFSCLGEHLQFRVLPFGLATSPCLFQRAMQNMLEEEMYKEGEQRKVFCYIDDVLIATESKEEHIQTLQWVLQRLEERGVLINPEKCHFMKKSVRYLGHIISQEGIQMEVEKVKAVLEFPQPKNASEARRFLGMAGFYRKFVKGFAVIASPLHKIKSGKERLHWTEEHEEAFKKLKEAVSKAPLLMQPDYDSAIRGERPFIITSDASGSGIGGVLTQLDENGVERPIAFHSRTLRGAEKHYSIVDAEALALYDCVQRWKGVIYGTQVTVRTDHAPLVSMFKRQNVAPRILRWATELSEFNLQIEYLKGKENTVADALSRAPIEEEGLPVTIGEDVVINRIREMSLEDREVSEEEDVEMGEVRGVQTRAQKEKSNEAEVRREKEEKIEEWRREQSKDEWVKKTREGLSEVERGKRKWSELVELPNSTMRLTWADLTMESGLLFIRSRDHRNLLYVPEWMRGKIVQDMHESVLLGHAGTKKLCQLLKREFVWGGMDKDVAEVIKKCTRCRLSNAGKKFVPELVPRVVKEPMEVVAVDLLDLGKGLRGSRYALVIIDMYSRYAGAYPIKDKKAETVARTFMDRWVLENGRVPKALLSDNGGEFVNGIMDEIIRLWKIESKTTLPYHSRANGGVERLNRTLTDILRRMEGSPEEWESALPYALYVYNNTPHSTTGETPAFLLYGRDERLPGGEPTKMDERYVVDRDDYLTRMQILMKKTHNEVNERLEVEREKMKKAYDTRNRYRKSNEPQMGDRVYVKRELNGEKNAKLMIEWEGPYRVIGRSTTTAELRRMEDGKEKTVQLDRIRKVEEEVTERGMRVRVVQEGDKKKLSRYEVVRGDRLDWNTPCRECGPRTLGEVWNSLPTAWHHLHIARARDLVVVAALRRIEGEGLGALYVKKSIERSDLSKVEKEDVEEGILRSLCQHATPLLEMAATTVFVIEKGLVPTRMEQGYKEALGEVPRTRKIRAMVLAHSDYERIKRQGGSEEDWTWHCTNHAMMETRAKEFAENGGKVVVLWPSQWATLEKVGTTLRGVARMMKGRGHVLIMIPPLSREDGAVEARWRDGWMKLFEEKEDNVRFVQDTGRHTMEGVGIDSLGLWISSPAREDYERILAAVVEGKKVRVWEKEKEKERDQEKSKSNEIICHSCGQAGHFRRKCPLLRRKEDVSGADEKKEEKGDERKERIKRTDEGGVRNRAVYRRDNHHEDRYRGRNEKGGMKRPSSEGRRFEGGGDAKKSREERYTKR